MKLYPWLGSILAHTLIFFLGGLAMSQQAEFAMELAPSSVEVTLIAAASAETETLETPKDETLESPEIIAPPEPDAMLSPKPNPPGPPKDLYKPKPLIQIAKKENAKGDGSSPLPGKDATTLKASRGSDGVAKPDYYRNPAPSYPEASRRAGHAGRVLLVVHVNAKGRVDDIEVKSSSGYSALDDSAVQSVQRWIFKPAKAAGIAVKSQVEVPIRFKLE